MWLPTTRMVLFFCHNSFCLSYRDQPHTKFMQLNMFLGPMPIRNGHSDLVNPSDLMDHVHYSMILVSGFVMHVSWPKFTHVLVHVTSPLDENTHGWGAGHAYIKSHHVMPWRMSSTSIMIHDNCFVAKLKCLSRVCGNCKELLMRWFHWKLAVVVKIKPQSWGCLHDWISRCNIEEGIATLS